MVGTESARRSLLAVGPHAGAHRVALRTAVSVLVPLLTLDAIGHLSWTLYAVFGAFTSLYGRERADAARLRLQATAGGWQVVSVTLGALVACSAQRGWVAVPVAAAIALLAAYASETQRWHPPGSLFQVFAVGAVASVPGRPGDIVPAVLVTAVSAAFAIAIGTVGAVARRARRVESPEPPERGVAIGGSTAGAWSYGVQAAIGVLVAGAIANTFDVGKPYWAMVGAVVPLAARAVPVQLVRGAHRLVGTGIGLLLAWGLLSIRLSTLAALIVAALLQAGAELYVGRNYALALLFVTPLALLMGQIVHPLPVGTLIADRGLETVIGVLVGVLVGLLWGRVVRGADGDG